MDYLRHGASSSEPGCTHVPERLASPNGHACEECGSTWSLRMCAICGHVGCCDSQAGDARRHYRETGHEVMVAMPVERGFRWCYAHDRYL
jgi:uncharacterized UBP type Zn finger protein